MQFPGYLVFDDDGKVAIELATFDETELDPATDWKQAWQNQDPAAAALGFVRLSDAIACAAARLAKSDAGAAPAEEIASIQAVESPFKDGRCVIQSLDDLRRFALFMMSLDHLQPWSSAHVAAAVEGLEREIPFDNVGPR